MRRSTVCTSELELLILLYLAKRQGVAATRREIMGGIGVKMSRGRYEYAIYQLKRLCLVEVRGHAIALSQDVQNALRIYPFISL